MSHSSAPLWVFDSFRPGTPIGHFSIPLDGARLAHWAAIYGEPDRADRVPSGLLVAAMMEAYLSAVQPRPPGNIHAGQKLTFGEPAYAGERLDAEVKCLWKELRKDRGWVAFGVVLRRGDSDVLRGEIQTIWAQ